MSDASSLPSVTSSADMKSLLLIGHSHVQAIISGDAAQALPLLNLQVLHARDPLYAPWANWEAGALVINPALIASIAGAIARIRPDAVAVNIDGSQHFVLGAVSHLRKFDFVLPDREDLPLELGAEIVPYDLMRQVFMHEQRNVLKLLVEVRAMASMPVYYLSVPPAIATFVEEHMPETWGKMRALGSPGAAMRFKLWTLYMDVVRELCGAMDVSFLPPPADVMDRDGFLLEAFDGDGLHGNAEYGKAVLRQLAGAIGADAA